MLKKSIGIILSIVMIICSVAVIPVNAAENVTITTTLEDGAVLKGSKKTFDVIARDADGNKVSASVTLNGESVPINWDDSEKTSFTLTLTVEGKNEIIITAGDATETIYITYEKAEAGDVTGKAVYSIEIFTIGLGYLIEPIEVDIIEGENAAQTLIRLIEECGYGVDYTGDPTSSFYLSGIAGVAGSLDSAANFPDYVLEALEANGFYPEYERYDEDWIGEFDYTWGSGWMYAVNNVFPNVGFADYYLSDGDVVRVQFTLAYGSDIGGGYMGDAYYEVANRDRLTALIAKVTASEVAGESEVSSALADAMDIVQVLNIDFATLDIVYDNLNKAYSAALNGGTCEHQTYEWKITKEPTFEEDGKEAIICSQCGETLEEKAINKYVYGDMNRDGGVNSYDLIICRQALSNSVILIEEQKTVADANDNGTFNIADLVRIKKIIAGIKV